jgi:pheromone receptor transcription factor
MHDPALPAPKKTKGKQKRDMKFITNKGLRQDTFYKRKAGIMKKAHELAVLTGNEMLILLTSETGNVFTYATGKFQPLFSANGESSIVKNMMEEIGIPPGQIYENQSWALQNSGQESTPQLASLSAPYSNTFLSNAVLPSPDQTERHPSPPNESGNQRSESLYNVDFSVGGNTINSRGYSPMDERKMRLLHQGKAQPYPAFSNIKTSLPQYHPQSISTHTQSQNSPVYASSSHPCYSDDAFNRFGSYGQQQQFSFQNAQPASTSQLNFHTGFSVNDNHCGLGAFLSPIPDPSMPFGL